jgi:hypothetical protein
LVFGNQGKFLLHAMLSFFIFACGESLLVYKKNVPLVVFGVASPIKATSGESQLQQDPDLKSL